MLRPSGRGLKLGKKGADVDSFVDNVIKDGGGKSYIMIMVLKRMKYIHNLQSVTNRI